MSSLDIQLPQESIDGSALQQFGYKQELIRKISFFGSFAVAFSAMSITTGIFLTYGFALKNCGPIAIWTWPLVALGQTLVAMIFAELAGRIPITGYSYQWVSRLTGPAVGWLCGWIAAFNFTVAISAINFGLAPVVAQVLGIAPSKSHLVVTILVILGAQALINMRGVRLASRINNAAVYTEIIGLLGLSAMLVIAGLFFKNASFSHPQLLFSFSPQLGGGSITALALGSLIGIWTFIGFEFAADLSEETLGATKVVPTSIIASMIVSAVVGMIFLVVITLAIPNLTTITKSETPIPDMLNTFLGPHLSTGFLCIVMASMFACSVIVMASVSRLIYSMARDGVFIFSNFFKKVSLSRVPRRAISFVFVLNILVALFANSLTDLLEITSICPVSIYLITVVSYASRRRSLPPVNTFNLGKWSSLLTFTAIGWLMVELAILVVPNQFHGGAKLSLLVVFAGVAIYFFAVRNHIVSGRVGIRDKYR